MKRPLIGVPVLAALIAVVILPVGVSVAVARRLALHEQQRHTAIIASKMLYRTHAISDQIARPGSLNNRLHHSAIRTRCISGLGHPIDIGAEP